jgi:hypothetical protein
VKFLLTPEGRRAAAFGAMTGGAMAMTIYASFALYLVRNEPEYALALGLAAHVAVFVVLTGYAALLVKRTIKASVAGSSFEAIDGPDAVAQVTTQTTVTATPVEQAE